MDNINGPVMNLANSIIGVSILAMPYCFKQCGIILSIFMLLISSIISRLTCHFLLKSAILARRKTFEFLSFHIFGPVGKFFIEVGMIGFLIGTCIAFFVVMGDLGPAIISEMAGVPTGNALRNSILVALAIFCVLPLGLLRNVDSLNGVSKATIGFYCCLVLKIVIEALPHIFTGDWVNHVVLWRPAGILQCLPIFSMALSCQTQIFEIYQTLPNATLDKMNTVVRTAVNICTCVYIFVGAFGYIAFFQKSFTGNILLSFRTSLISDMIKMGFVLSLAFSFPLVIFPCRASLYSLLYKGHSYTALHEGAPSNYIPEGKFKMLTLIIVLVSLSIGLLIPTIELVLGLMGSTIGVMICVIFPVTCFICISPKNTNERILAQILLFVGVIVMVMGTYANLYALEEVKMQMTTEKPAEKELKENFIPKFNVMDIPTTVKPDSSEYQKLKDTFELRMKVPPDIKEKSEEAQKEVRHEPPQPEEPVENPPQSESPKVVKINEEKPKLQEPKEEVKKDNEQQGPVVEPVQPEVHEVKKEAVQPKSEEIAVKKLIPDNVDDAEGNKRDLSNQINEPVESKDVIPKKEIKKNDEVDIEAIKKEETELKEQEKEKPVDDKNQLLIDTIQKQHDVQKEIVEQQKKLIEVIQRQQENANNKDLDIVNEEKLKAVKEIESIAKKAIESISGQDVKIVAKEEKPTDNKSINNKPEENVVVENKPNESKPLEDKSIIVNKSIENIIAPPRQEVKEKRLDQIVEPQIPKEKKNESNKISLLPLPIALAKLNNVNVETKKEESAKPATEKKKYEVNKSAEDAKAMRRDILAESNDGKVRAKRDAEENKVDDNSDKVEKVNKAIKEVCEEMNRLTSTEKPIIKMLCKLSEPALVEVNINGVEKQSSVDVKPQKRDLKEFPEH